ncbi:hypothetical protein SLEP1_g20828 [Rubroshorea leprosula]|uniref:Endonuclease/exonuclease/phosphatase domain-containing protein n=1 Tax=Rubroshorea leprosula TaxID=152421 RepID=A0AAV5JD46_9ROSI|nr:hypothetical protein SLEP1_g20828 [Rubroshorea leprosula]
MAMASQEDEGNARHLEKLITCSVHNEKLASVQCIDCVKLNIPKEQSYHCTPECFAGAWERHKNSHRNAAECKTTSTFGDQCEVNKLKRSSGSWPESLDEIAEQEGAKWVKVGSSIIYDPSNDGIRLPLRLESFAIDHAEGTHFSPVENIVTGLLTFPLPSPRLMVGIGSNEKYLSSDGFVFTVLSYNILADMHTKGTQRQSYCPKWALCWEYRRQNLLNEIIEYDADIICLQEVQDNHYESFFKPELTKRGYSALYKKKTNEIFTAEGYVSEGCATFYRHNLFREIVIYELEFNRKAQVVQEALEPELQNDGATRLRMHNVALIVVLQALRDGSTDVDLQSRICVANTHVYSEKNRPDVRVFQVATLIHKLEEITQLQIPMLICADLNSVPGSDPHALLIKGEINSIEGNNPLHIERFIRLVHSLHLESAYASFPENFTIFTQKFAGTLDYILYSGMYP